MKRAVGYIAARTPILLEEYWKKTGHDRRGVSGIRPVIKRPRQYLFVIFAVAHAHPDLSTRHGSRNCALLNNDAFSRLMVCRFFIQDSRDDSMKRYSPPRNALCLGSVLFFLSAGWQGAVAETMQNVAPVEPTPTAEHAGETDPLTTPRESERRAPPATSHATDQRPAKATSAATRKSAQDPLEQLQSQIRVTQREREEAAQEHQLLKARLVEMEKKIQELMQQNAERDAALKAQSRTTNTK